MNETLKQYLISALWSSIDDDGNPFDDNYTVNDIAAETVTEAQNDLTKFLSKAGTLVEGIDSTDVAHDFWMTRNRHGCGFWDGDYPKEIGEKLTKIAQSFKETDVYLGDDGKIYFT